MSISEIDEDTRNNLRRDLFGSIAELADVEFQRVTWLDVKMQNPHFSCIEFVECFYDVAGASYDNLDPNADDAPLRGLVDHGYLTKAEMNVIWPVHVALTRFRPRDYYVHSVILADPDWLMVTAAAAEAKTSLMNIVDARELRYFDSILPGPAQKRWP